MAHLTMRGVLVLTNPLLQPGLDALSAWLMDRHYSSWAASRIVARVAVEGELTGTVAADLLDPEDEAAAAEVFVSAFPEVPDDSPAWNGPAVYLDRESILEAAGGRPDDEDRSIPPQAVIVPPELDPDDEPLSEMHPLALSPISGGAPAADQRDDDPFANDPGMSFPRTLMQMRREDPAGYREHQRRFQADVRRWFAEHPESGPAA